jgi:hypothetical protein
MTKTSLRLACCIFILALTGATSSHADDSVDCYFSNNGQSWLKDEACYRANYNACLHKKDLGAPLSADCKALLDNPPLPKGTCTVNDHLDNKPGCVPPQQVRD